MAEGNAASAAPTVGSSDVDPHAGLWDAVEAAHARCDQAESDDELVAAHQAARCAEAAAVVVVPTSVRGILTLLSVVEQTRSDDPDSLDLIALDSIREAISSGKVTLGRH